MAQHLTSIGPTPFPDGTACLPPDAHHRLPAHLLNPAGKDISRSKKYLGNPANYPANDANSLPNAVNDPSHDANYLGNDANHVGHDANYLKTAANYLRDTADYLGSAANYLRNAVPESGQTSSKPAKTTGNRENRVFFIKNTPSRTRFTRPASKTRLPARQTHHFDPHPCPHR